MRALKSLLVLGFVVLSLVACGGGGSSGSSSLSSQPVTSSLAFPLDFAFKEVLLGGSSDLFSISLFSVSGNCNGSGFLSSQTPSAAIFESTSGVAVQNVSSMDFPVCQTDFINYSTDYYDANLNALGSTYLGNEYGVFLTPPSIPASVHVGDSGIIGTQQFFSDSSKTVSIGRDDISYVIEPDTAETAIAKLTIKSFNAAGVLDSVQQDSYRIWANGVLTHASSDIQTFSISPDIAPQHFVLSAQVNPQPGWASSVSPLNPSPTASIYAVMTATFSKPMDAATINTSTFLVSTVSGNISGSITYRGRTATFTPDAPMPVGTVNTTITTGAKDLDGYPISNDIQWSFVASTPPEVVSTIPARSATDVSVGASISATFGEFLNSHGVASADFTLMNGTQVVPGTVSFSNKVATFTPASPLTSGTLYTATISAAGVANSYGVTMRNDYSWSFTTFANNISPLPPLSQSVAFQIDYAHTGRATFGGAISFPASATWSVPFDGAVSYPLIAEGKVFVIAAGASTTAQLYALDKQTGSVLWGPVVTSTTQKWSAHAYDHGKIFVVNASGQVSSFDAATGQAIWSVQLPDGTTSPPTAVNGIVYVSVNNGLYALSESTGYVIWSASVFGGQTSSPTVTQDGVFVTYPCQAYKFDPYSAASLWHYSGGCSGGGGETSPYVNGSLYMRGDWPGTSAGIIFDAATGSQTGSFTATQTLPAFTDQTGFFLNGNLNAYSLSTNNLLWSFAGDGHLISAPIVIDQVVIIGSSAGTVFALDANSGAQLWSNSAGSAITAPNEMSLFTPLTGFGAGEGYLVVPAGNVLSAWHLFGP